MTSLQTLLDVQEHDTLIEQLKHRRQTLPERSELAAVEAAIAELDRSLDDVRGRRDEVVGRQEALERQLASLEDRIAEIDRRLYSNQAGGSRDQQAMAVEIDHLKSRCSELEDAALAAMEEREPLDAAVADLEAKRATLEAQGAQLHGRIAEAEVDIDAEVSRETEVRASLAAALPAELAATYERLRARLGGVGAARLVGASCSGCHLTLPATEIDRLRREPADAIIYCDQCGRILVR